MAHYVEKIRVGVHVSFGSPEPVSGSLSLAPQARDHDGPETILELLNSNVRVIPFARASDGSVVLLTRQNLVWVAASPDLDPRLICPPTYRVTREEHVQVVLPDGSRFEGLLQMELPEDLNRASDFLNGSEDYFPLVTGMGTLLINKLRLRETLVYESSPLPLTPRIEAR